MTNVQVDSYKEYEQNSSSDLIYDEEALKELSFEELVEYRKAIGYRVYGVQLDIGVIVDRAWYMDLSWECLEELADACVYLDFEIQKLRNREAKLEASRLTSVVRSIKGTANTIKSYRERVSERFPEIFKETLQDEIRAGTISEI